MKSRTKYALVYLTVLTVTALLAINLAQAQESKDVVVVDSQSNQNTNESEQEFNYELDQAELDQMLAPIALYPDSVLSHILVASTYPLEVVQAARWRDKNQSLNEEEVMEAIAEQDWDPSVKALVPFHELLQQITEDLNWLQDLGDAFLINEEQVLSSVQGLRHKAYAQGSLENSEYIEVVEEDNDIVIQSTKTEVVYVPYYDTRIVYGNWWWHNYPPIYWHRPAHYYRHAGFYWSPRVYVRHSVFWGGFNWGNRYIVVNNHYSHRNYRRDDGVRRVNSNEYQRWQHNPNHRRGVRYNAHTPKVVYRVQDRHDNRRVNVSEGKARILDKSRPVQVRQREKDIKNDNRALRTQQKLQSQANRRSEYIDKNNKTTQRQRVERDNNKRENIRQVPAQSRNNVVNRSQDNVQQREPNRERVQRNNYNSSDVKVQNTNRSQSNVNTSSKQRYSNQKVHSTQRNVKSYSPNRSNVQRTVNRNQNRQINKGNRRER